MSRSLLTHLMVPGPQERFYTWHIAMSQQGHHNSGGLSLSTTVGASLVSMVVCWGPGYSYCGRIAVLEPPRDKSKPRLLWPSTALLHLAYSHVTAMPPQQRWPVFVHRCWGLPLWSCWGAGNSLWTRIAVTCFCGSKKHLPSDLMHDLQKVLHVETVCPSAERLCCMMRQPQLVQGVLLLAAWPDPEADGCLSRDTLLS